MPKAKKTATRPARRDNSADGRKAHHDERCYKVGRIRHRSWATQAMPAGDIVVYERELVHIGNKRKPLLDELGFTAYDYVYHIVNNFTEIYEGKDGCKMLTMRRPDMSHYAVAELVYEDGVHRIKTAVPIETRRLSKLRLLCAGARYPSR